MAGNIIREILPVIKDRGTRLEKMDTISVIGDNIQVRENRKNRHVTIFRPGDILSDWKRCGRLADRLSGIYTSREEDLLKYTACTTIINEIIENSVKYTCDNMSPVALTTFMQGKNLLIKISNIVSEEMLRKFMGICREIYSSDLDGLMTERLSSIKTEQNSGLIGLIMLKKNFNTDLNFTFSRKRDSYQVTILVSIKL